MRQNNQQDNYAGHPLRFTPPESVRRRLDEEGVDPEHLLLCTHSDIDLAGRYDAQWLSVTPDRLLVVSEENGAHVRLSMPVNAATEYRTQSGVGSGLLQARVEGAYVDVMRYSNRHAFSFERIARKLDHLLHGAPVQILPEDEFDPQRCRRCGLMLDQHSDVCPRCVNRGAVLLRMWRLMRHYRRASLAMMSLLLVGIALDLMSPQLTRYLVDEVLPGGAVEAAGLDDAVRRALHLNMLLQVVLVLAAVQVLRMTVNLVNGRLSSFIGTSITFDMRGRLFAHLEQLSVGFYDRQQVGSLVGRVAYDTEALHGFINQLTGGALLQILLVFGVTVMMFITDAKLAFYTLIPAPIVIGGTLIFWRYVHPRNYRSWDASGRQAGLLSGLLSGIRVVKAFGQEGRERSRFDKASRRLRDSRRGVESASATFNSAMGIVFQLGGWIVWYVGGRDVIEQRLTLGTLMAFFGYLWMFYGPLATLPHFTNWLTTFVTQAHRVFEILDTPIQIADPPSPVDRPSLRGDIRFENVTFGYHRHSPVVRELSLDIRAGESLGVVGHSGSGKTTLVNLLCRFYDVEDGAVLVDGVDVRELRRSDLRRQIGVVLQEPFLFGGSIWDNLCYGRPEAPADNVIAASMAGNCHEFIMRQAHAYDTWLGERGAGLSGGERQRVGIARVLLTDPRILILDEATSNVDAESEAAIQAALAEVVRGRTTIAIAHRLSTLSRTNRIIVMERGRIVESGTHANLLRQNGIYARMLRLQQGTVPATEPAGDAPAAEGAGAGAALPALGGHRIRWLQPDLVHIHLGTYNTLHVTVQGERIYSGVFALRCLPIQYPREFISLRYVAGDGRDLEVGLIRRLGDWPLDAQELIQQSLQRRYFVHTIHSIESIELINDYLDFVADTDLGPQHFTVRWHSNRVVEYGTRGRMLLDTDENRYLIPDVQALTPRERTMFERFIYW